MRLFNWVWRAALFFVLFAFALNNQHAVDVRWFFGHQWRAPMVFVVLIVFVLGCACGVLAMLPSWWRHRRKARQREMLLAEPLKTSPAAGSTDGQTGNPDGASMPPLELPHPPDMPAPRKPAR